MKKIIIGICAFGIILLNPSFVFAHAGIQPKEVGIGSIQTFTLGVPNERDDESTTGVRLVIPEGVTDIMPEVKPGWKITLQRNADSEVTQVMWTGGTIPPEQRDVFTLTAQSPTQETTITWKAYQTYSSGDIVAWDTNPEIIAQEAKQKKEAPSGHDEAGKKPYSTTRVINDLKEEATTTTFASSENNTPMALSVFALVLSAIALGKGFLAPKKRK